LTLDFWRGFAVGGLLLFVVATLLNVAGRVDCLYG